MPNYVSNGNSDWYKVSETEQEQHRNGTLTLATIKSTKPKA